MAEKYESFEKYLINHIFEQLPDITQPVYAEVSKVFYEENVGGVLYQFEFDFPSIDDMPLKKGLSGTDIPDFNKIAKDTSVKVQRVFPDGEVIVDFEFNVAGRGGDLEAYKTFSKSLAEGKGMKGVLLDYYDTFPVETTLPTTLENDITIPNTLEGTDTPTNVVDDIKLSGFGGNTNVKGNNIAYVDVEELFPYVEFDRRINPKSETDIDLIKQTVLDKGYMYDTGYNSGVVFPMYIDSQGNIMMGEGNHRIRALYEVTQETGQKIYIPINLDTGFQLDNVSEATKITDSSTVESELNKLFKEFEEIAGLQKGDTNDWIITTGDRKGRIAQKAVSYLSPGGKGLPQSSVARFLNAIGINAITYNELPDNSIYKTGVNTFIDTPTNVVDEVNKLQDNINDYLNEIILENPSRSADLAVDPLTLTLSDDGKFIDITEFVIDENYRNQGLGTEVFNRIKEFANNNNLSITTTPFVGELEDLVKKEGFVKEGNQYILKPDTPTNVVDEVSELQDTLRNKYKNELDELHIIKRPFYDPIKEINTQNGIFIEEIILKPEFRGSGIGTEIVDEIKQFATENNYGIELEPVRGENAVIRFWENQDFELQEYFDDKGNLITNDKELNNVYKWTPDTPDRPFGPGAAHIDEILNANTQLVNELPLSQTVKNQFDNFLRTRARNLTTSGAIDAVDIWELGVTGLMITAIAYKELDEIPTIFKRTATNMFNSMTAPYNIPPVPLEEYDLDYEFINKVLTTGEKVMPTDIIIKKVGDVVKGAAETGAVTGFGYVPPNLTKTDTMETTQKIQPGVQEEKMFEQAKPKKSSGGAGAKIL
ncbi:MAG: hypothetical protein CMA31_02065 [Euryarchaeota archaeon]|nr:hypothetical protein [Euryarchaeota archaeon]